MPKILWMSPYSLHDISSGASINCKYLLEALAAQGYEVWALSSFIFDMPSGAQLFTQAQDKLAVSAKPIFELNDNGIHYIYQRCHSTFEGEQSAAEQEVFFTLLREVLDRFAPDLCMAFGTSMLTMTCFAEAKRRGITTIYPVLNGNHGSFSFPDVDLLLTDSQATADLYFKRDRIRAIPIGAFFVPERFVAKKRHPKYVTMINPSFEKGLAILARLSLVCQSRLPEVRFLVVNSRGNFAENVQYLHEKDQRDVHPLSPQDFVNVDMTPATTNMKPIYAATKVLVAPSLWFESWGRVVSEAVYNGIPVLASNSGGLAEAAGGASINLPVPEHCRNDYLSLPSLEDIEPWVVALERLLNEDWSEQVSAAQQRLAANNGLARFNAVVQPYLDERARDHLHFNR